MCAVSRHLHVVQLEQRRCLADLSFFACRKLYCHVSAQVVSSDRQTRRLWRLTDCCCCITGAAALKAPGVRAFAVGRTRRGAPPQGARAPLLVLAGLVTCDRGRREFDDVDGAARLSQSLSQLMTARSLCPECGVRAVRSVWAHWRTHLQCSGAPLAHCGALWRTGALTRVGRN